MFQESCADLKSVQWLQAHWPTASVNTSEWLTSAAGCLTCCVWVQNYNQTRHEFEIHLENASQVDPCPEEAEEIPQIQYHVSAVLLPFASSDTLDDVNLVDPMLLLLCLPAYQLAGATYGLSAGSVQATAGQGQGVTGLQNLALLSQKHLPLFTGFAPNKCVQCNRKSLRIVKSAQQAFAKLLGGQSTSWGFSRAVTPWTWALGSHEDLLLILHE